MPDGAVVPDSWRALPALSPAERVELMVSVMGETVGEHLPRTLRGLRERCVDAELAVHGGEYFVVYTFFNADGKEVSYVGGNPLRPSWPEAGEDGYADNVRRVWEHVPESVGILRAHPRRVPSFRLGGRGHPPPARGPGTGW